MFLYERYEIPKNYEDRLRDYQKEGYQWLRTLSACSLGGLLADDMDWARRSRSSLIWKASGRKAS